MAQDTTTSSSQTSSATLSATSSASSSASSTHIITIVTAAIFGTLGLVLLMSVFGFMLKKRGLRRTKSNDFEKNNPYQNHNTGNKAMSTANLPSFAWERTTQAPAELAIAAQNEQSKLLNNNRATESQLKVNRASNVGQGSTQTLTPLLRDVDDSNVTTAVTPDPHRHAQSAGENVIAYITYNDPGFTSNHCLSSTGLVPLQIERQPSPPSPLVSKHGSLHSITTCTATSSGPNSSTDSRPSTRSASTSQKIMTSSLPPPLPPSICIQPHTPVVESHDEPQHRKEPEKKEAKEESPKLVPSTLPSPPITPSSFYSSPSLSSSSCSVNTTAAAPPTPPTTTCTIATMASNTSHLPPSLRPGNGGNRSTLALPVPMAAYLGCSNDSSSTASKRQSMPGSAVRTGSTRRRTLSNPLHIQLHLNPLQQIGPAPTTAVPNPNPNAHRHSRSHSTGRDSTSSNGSHGSGASSSSSSSSASASSANNNNRQSNHGGSHNRTAKHHKRLSTFDAHRLSEQMAAREWAQARARSRSASRSSVNQVAGAGRYYAGGNSAGASTTSLVPAQAENGETGASGGSGANVGAGSANADANGSSCRRTMNSHRSKEPAPAPRLFSTPPCLPYDTELDSKPHL
ncbi:hypothetical protein BKA80DRAFT_312667 [Phyllosticta citrichinensis]